MAKRKTSMKKIREIIRLYEEAELSKRKIAQALGISRPVVSQYIIDIKAANLKYADIKDMPDDCLLEILSGNKKENKDKYGKLLSKFDYYSKELRRTGVTLQLLWEEYKAEESNAYSYSQFCYHYQVWKEASEISMHMEHKSGDKMYVDFTGKKLQVIDRVTGEIIPVEVFVAVLGASQLTYVEAVEDQKKERFIRANENAFRYFGGVTGAIVPDCLKSAVTKANKYEPDINPEYFDFSRHYNTAILPARPVHPRDKPHVENAVKIVYSWIFARIRNEEFFSLSDLNKRIRELLEVYNNKPMQRPRISRRELFNEIEINALKPLPEELYEIKHYKRLKVQFNYHVYLSEDRHYYSVPYRARGKYVELFFSEKTVEIYENNTRIAIHVRSRKVNGYTTLKDHMPQKHQWMADWNSDRLIKWALNLGSPVKDIIETVLLSKEHPEQAYKTCLGILNLSKKYSVPRLVKACERAFRYECCSYKAIENILKNKMEVLNDEPDLSPRLPDHENIRGINYYNYNN
jgi:transposase